MSTNCQDYVAFLKKLVSSLKRARRLPQELTVVNALEEVRETFQFPCMIHRGGWHPSLRLTAKCASELEWHLKEHRIHERKGLEGFDVEGSGVGTKQCTHGTTLRSYNGRYRVLQGF